MIQIQGIIEKRDTQNIYYILQSQELFFQTGYKVLRSQEKNGFIRCSKVLHNGMDKLVYDISKFKSLDLLLQVINPNTFMTILINLIDVVIAVKNNGFMQCENIDLSFDKVFVDCKTYKVYLIYLPIDTPTSSNSYTAFEEQLKNNIINAVNANTNLVNKVVMTLSNNIRNPINTIESIRGSINTNYSEQLGCISNNQWDIDQSQKQEMNYGSKEQVSKHNNTQQVLRQNNEKNSHAQQQYENNQNINVTCAQFTEKKKKRKIFDKIFFRKQEEETIADKINYQSEFEGGATEILDDEFIPNIVLVGINTPIKVEIEITKDEFLIGKKKDSVDAAIEFNNAISRIHCKIIHVDGKYFIVDLGSTNGTFVNGTRMNVNQKITIEPGDKIRLGNSEFMIKSI